MRRPIMKIAVYKDPRVEGLVPQKTDTISADGDISLLFNGEDGFSIDEVVVVVTRFFMCSLCGSSIGVEAEYKSNKPSKIRLASVIDGAIPVYNLERTEGSIYYRWRCLGDNGRECTATYGWRTESPPVLKSELKIGGDYRERTARRNSSSAS